MKTIISLLFLIGIVGYFSACKKDDPFVKPKLSFEKTTLTVNEADKTVSVNIVLDKPFNENIDVTYALKGTAQDKTSSNANTAAPDYEIVGQYLEAKILKGETTGKIDIKLYSDLDLEDPETIIVTIKSVDSDNIEITRDDEIEVTVNQEDGLIVFLEWPAPTTSSQADMDILVRAGANTTTWSGFLTGSANGSFSGPELIFLPKVTEFAAYGMSYVYYDGNADPLNFKVTFIDLVDGALEAVSQRQSFSKTYTAANKNKWDNNTINTTVVVQTITKSGSSFGTPSDITVPASGSRLSSMELPTQLTKTSTKNLSKIAASLLR